MSFAVTVLSGGMDSTVLAHLTTSLNERVDLVSVDYGQRHKAELDFAARTAAKLRCRHDIVSLPIGEALSGSALTDASVDVPHGHYAEDNMALTVVPNRNAILISVAYGIAVARGATTVQVGVHAGDHFVYPDCRPAFIDQFGVALKTGNEGFGQPELVAPFVAQSKTDICRLGDKFGVDWTDTWSCYEGGTIHCGRCGTCVERRAAFRDADVQDPTEYLDPHYAFEVLARGDGR